MGFYGNITNTAKTQFTFDRTYPNRKTMESRLATDEIYLGRYVLVEYDLTNKETLDTYLRVWRNSRNQFFTSSGMQAATRIKYTEEEDPNNPGHGKDNAVIYNQLVYTEDDTTKAQTFYKCIGSSGSDGQGGYYAAFESVVYSENNYTQNYNIDMSVYGEGRGYDSTVWQKVYTQGTEKFVMIAELNSVVPTFDIVADAPTMTPITPHFDANSTNVYYKLHWQPQWGMRIAEADDATQSDMLTAWIRERYDAETDKTLRDYYDYEKATWTYFGTSQTAIPEKAYCVPAAIFFNNSALDPQVDESRTTNDGINKEVGGDNIVSVLPTGVSGITYPRHDGTSRVKTAPDIQEFRINLPVIGDTMSKAYDIIHGELRNNSPADSLQGRLNFFKEMDANEIPVQSEGKYLVGSTMTGDEWISPSVNVVETDDEDLKYHQNAITFEHTFNKGTVSTEKADVNGNGDTIDLYVPEVDETGHVVGSTTTTTTLPYGFKSVNFQGATNQNESAEDEVENSAFSITAENTQDTLNIYPGNKWIRLGQDANGNALIGHKLITPDVTEKDSTNLDGVGTFTVQDLQFDKAGHVTHNQPHTYNLPNGIRNVQVTSSESTDAGENENGSVEANEYNSTLNLTAQNRWINLKVDVENDEILIGHAAAGNESVTAGSTAADTPAFGSKFTVPYVKYDEMGHIKSNGTKDVTIPKGSLTDTESSDTAQVLTSIGFTDTTGAITATHQNVGTLKLTGYSSVNSSDKTFIQSEDTLNQALNKLDTRFNGLDVVSKANENQVVYGITQTDGKIEATHKNVGELKLGGYSALSSVSDTDLSATDTLNNALGKLEYNLKAETKRATEAIESLDVDTISTNDYEVFSSISETDGKVSATKKNLSDVKLYGFSVGDTSSSVAAEDSVNEAFSKLQKQINNITDSSVDGSISKQITAAVEGLDSDKTVDEGKYITGIHIVDGKLSAIDQAELPTYVSNVQSDWDAEEGSSAAILHKPTNLVTTNDIAEMVVKSDIDGMVTTSTQFTYAEATDTTEALLMTIAELMQKVKELEDRVAALEPTT